MTVVHMERGLSRDAVTCCTGGGMSWQSPRICMRVGHLGMGVYVYCQGDFPEAMSSSPSLDVERQTSTCAVNDVLKALQ
jgi:hypothetical protein